MKNNHASPTIQSVVNQLRQEGKLDEEKWQLFKKKHNDRFLILLTIGSVFFVVSFFIGNDFWAFLFSALGIIIALIGLCELSNANKIENAHKINAFSCGPIVAAKVTDVRESGYTDLPRNNNQRCSYKFFYEFNVNDQKYTGVSSNIQIVQLNKEGKPIYRAGDDIEIVYAPNNPKKNYINFHFNSLKYNFNNRRG